MKKSFKKYFIPHEENDHKPHFLRESAVMVTATVIVILFFASVVGTYLVKHTNFLANIQSAFLVDLANIDRSSEGLNYLAINDKLTRAAQLKADDMARKSYFAHTSPEGVTPWHWFDQAQYDYIYAGENLAVNFSRGEDVQRAWMNSPSHKANILNNKYKEIGIATAEGVYKGRNTTFVVQMFGSPARSGLSALLSANVSTSVNSPEDDALNSESIVAGANISIDNPRDMDNFESSLITQEVESFIETTNPLYENSLNNNGEVVPAFNEARQYTNWFERFVINPGDAVNKAYVALFVIILFSVVLKIFIAIRKQHVRNIIYGCLLLVLILIFMHLNQQMFLEPIVAGIDNIAGLIN